jgi:hypothetical protein
MDTYDPNDYPSQPQSNPYPFEPAGVHRDDEWFDPNGVYRQEYDRTDIVVPEPNPTTSWER